MANGQWLKAEKVLRSPKAPQNLLVNKVIFLRAEARKSCACATWKWLTDAVATLGYNLVDIYFRSRIAQNCLLHNLQHFYKLNYSVTYCAGL